MIKVIIFIGILCALWWLFNGPAWCFGRTKFLFGFPFACRRPYLLPCAEVLSLIKLMMVGGIGEGFGKSFQLVWVIVIGSNADIVIIGYEYSCYSVW